VAVAHRSPALAAPRDALDPTATTSSAVPSAIANRGSNARYRRVWTFASYVPLSVRTRRA